MNFVEILGMTHLAGADGGERGRGESPCLHHFDAMRTKIDMSLTF